MEDTKAFDVTEEKNIPSESDGTDRGNVAVAVKYMGTDTDRLDMTILGRKQVLRVGVRSRLYCLAGWRLLHLRWR